MKRCLSLILFCFVSFCSYSQIIQKPDYIRNDKRILLEALTEYESNNFGTSLKLVEEAKEQRRQQSDWEYTTLQNSFKSFDVKKAGDNLNDITAVLLERQDYEAIELIKKYSVSRGADEIAGSKKNLLAYIKKNRQYPEADKLAGDIYKIEGEYELANKYYTEALKNAQILDVPDEKFDILYELADISYTLNNDDDYEKELLLIVAQDDSFKDESLINAMKSTIASVKPDCVEKFFKLYRSNNYRVLTAYANLSQFYETKNKMDKALICSSLCALTGFTKIFDVVSKRNPNFEYDGLYSLLQEASCYEDIVNWGINNNVWKGFHVFAENAYKTTNPIFAVQLFTVLANCSPEEYWRNRAELRLKEITLTR